MNSLVTCSIFLLTISAVVPGTPLQESRCTEFKHCLDIKLERFYNFCRKTFGFVASKTKSHEVNKNKSVKETNLGNFRRVIGGSYAYENQFPFIVSLRINDFHFCGGAIIKPTWIISAAHCFDTDYDYVNEGTIYVGTNKLHGRGTTYHITSVHSHPYFNHKTFFADIALVRTTPIRFSHQVRPIPLASTPMKVGAIGVVPGWGDTEFDGNLSEDLKMVEMMIINMELCKWKMPMKVEKTLMCAVAFRGYGSCNGDSGGPMVKGGKLVGITSWGVQCASANPETFTKVEMFRQWVDETIYRVEKKKTIYYTA